MLNNSFLALGGLLLTSPFIHAQKQTAKPNIIVFLVDDMGVMDTSLPFLTDCNGNPVRYPLNNIYRTPNMEKLAHQGIRFSTFYAQSVSSPTRASIMTGQNSARHGTTNWINSENNNRDSYGPYDWNWEGITKETITLPRILHSQGYKTIHVGKAHFAPFHHEGENPLNVGFDVNIAGNSIGQPGSYLGTDGFGNIHGNKSRAVPGLKQYEGKDIFLTEALTLEANKEISKSIKEKKPFFLYMAHYAVHTPFMTDKRFAAHYKDAPINESTKKFATLIEGMDKSLGDIVQHLKDLKIAKNTLILFIGDNGSTAFIGDQRGYGASAPLKGMKGTEYEGGTRVPCIVSWAAIDTNTPQQKKWEIAQDTIITQPATVNDVFPTVLSFTDAKNPQGHIIDGFSMVKMLQGKHDTQHPTTVLMHFPHQHRGSYFTTWRNNDWKLIYKYNPETPKKPDYELYDLKVDPFETCHLEKTYPKKVYTMVKEMITELKKEGAKYPVDKDGNTLHPILP